MNNYDLAGNLARAMLTQIQSSSGALTPEDIETAVDNVNNSQLVNPPLTEAARASLLQELQSDYETIIGVERELLGTDDDGWEPWLESRKTSIDWAYSNRYITHLSNNGFNEKVIERLNRSTDRIIGLTGDPTKDGVWDRRGLVVGLVQSGKTANYLSLVNKAIDTGYKVIIILTGFTESLRAQTQLRVQDGVLGRNVTYDKKAKKIVATPCGVGQIPPKPEMFVDCSTTASDDFKTSIAKNHGISIGGKGTKPIIFVVKKNASVLRNLLAWVHSYASPAADGTRYVGDAPLLVIDDESDVGSVDTKKGNIDDFGDADEDHDPTKINKQIRKLLELFNKSSYVGYTATPFANVLIHSEGKVGIDSDDDMRIGEDLFPRSFIVSLPTPSNHVGPTKIFGVSDSDGLPIIRTVVDVELGDSKSNYWMPRSHKASHFPRYKGQDRVPPSLREAMHHFLLACAARNLRGDRAKHCSMLIHVTRFIDVQGRVYDQVERELKQIRDVLRDNSDGGALLSELKEIWTTDESSFQSVTGKIRDMSPEALYQNPVHSWRDIQTELTRAAESIAVRKIHGNSGQDLDYSNHKDGLKVIAIGGDKLSRGLTLEGLTVSYFLRASKMYDTLMQMGRWFGYRPGYVDLCRLFTTQDMSEWFGHIAEATEELRDEFDRMAIQKRTPKDFGLRILSHPTMLVTSQVKMRHGSSIQITFNGDISETIDFHRNAEAVRHNYDAAHQLFESIVSSYGVGISRSLSKSKYWEDIESDYVLKFLADYAEHKAAKKVKPRLLHEYIRKENGLERLRKWTVVLAAGLAEETHEFSGISVPLVLREWYLGRGLSESEADEQRNELIKDDHYRIKRLVSPSDEAIGLTENQKQEALDLTLKRWRSKKEGKEPTTPSGMSLRQVRDEDNGLLMIYPLNTDGTDKQVESTGLPTLGFAISFPTVAGEPSKVTYMVNNIYQQEAQEDD